MPVEVGHFAAFPLFSNLHPDTVKLLAQHAQKRQWPADGLIFQFGDQSDHMLAILSGRARVALTSADGKDLMLCQVVKGDILGELAVLDGLPRSAEAVAVEPTTALVLHRDRFLAVAALRPDLGLAMARHVCALLRNTNFQMESIALHSLQNRLVRFILHSLSRSDASDLEDRAVLAQSLNQSDLSSILGASRPKLNQALQLLIHNGAISRQGDTLLCDVARLRVLAETSASASLR